MKLFIKDYGKLCKESLGFLKKHWVGSFIIFPTMCGLMCGLKCYIRHKHRIKQTTNELNKLIDEINKTTDKAKNEVES